MLCPGDLFLILVGVTYLRRRQEQRHVDWLVQAAVLHDASSVAVVTNSARLIRSYRLTQSLAGARRPDESLFR
jgi:hypothetical protein